MRLANSLFLMAALLSFAGCTEGARFLNTSLASLGIGGPQGAPEHSSPKENLSRQQAISRADQYFQEGKAEKALRAVAPILKEGDRDPAYANARALFTPPRKAMLHKALIKSIGEATPYSLKFVKDDFLFAAEHRLIEPASTDPSGFFDAMVVEADGRDEILFTVTTRRGTTSV